MNDTVDAAITELRTRFATLTPAVNVYKHSPPDFVPGTTVTVKPPFAYIYAGDELIGVPYYGRKQDIVTLHLFARSKPELGLMLDQCLFLDDYRAPSTGNAYAPYFQVQSKPAQEEGDGVWHATPTYTVDYTDRRLFT